MQPKTVDTLEGIIAQQIATRTPFTEDQVLQVVQNVALGLKELHTCPTPILHRNLAVSPILVFKIL